MYLFWLLSFSVVVLNERRIKEFSQKIHPSSSVMIMIRIEGTVVNIIIDISMVVVAVLMILLSLACLLD